MCYTCQTRSNIYTGMCYRAPTIFKCLMIWALEPTNLPLGSTGTMTLGRKAGKLNVESVEASSITKPTALNLPPSIRVPHVGRTATLACKVSQGPLEYPAFCSTKTSRILCDLSQSSVSPYHLWASFSKLNFITCQIFQPLKNYSIPGLIYNIISKRLASSELSSSWNDAWGVGGDSKPSGLPQPWLCTKSHGCEQKRGSTFEHHRNDR